MSRQRSGGSHSVPVNQLEGFCNRCQKRSYPNRKRARRARKLTQQSNGLAVYPCPHDTGMFHIGHMAPGVRTGSIDRRHRS